ncbi:MAG: hypothetical protein ACHQ2F_10345 [Desulfobaccales bacterium]
MPGLWHRISRISLRRQRVGRVQMAQGDLLPPFCFDYARPRHRLLLGNPKRYLTLGFYQVFILDQVPPAILQ